MSSCHLCTALIIMLSVVWTGCGGPRDGEQPAESENDSASAPPSEAEIAARQYLVGRKATCDFDSSFHVVSVQFAHGDTVTRNDIRQLKQLPRLTAVVLNMCQTENDDVLNDLAAVPTLQELNLANTFLKGDAIKVLANCHTLRSLELWGSTLKPEHVRDLPLLKHLTSLDLSDCIIDRRSGPTGRNCSWDDRAMQVLVEMDELESVSIYTAGLSLDGLGMLSQLPRLRELEIASSKSTIGVVKPKSPDDELAAVSKNTKLEKLTYCDLGFGRHGRIERGLEHLERLPALKSLKLQHSPLSNSSAGPLGRLKSLQSLTIDCKEIGPDVLPVLAPLNNLVELQIINAQIGAGNVPPDQRETQGLYALTGLSRLERLVLRNAGITDADDAALAQLTGLRELELVHLAVKPDTFQMLARLKSLKKLDLFLLSASTHSSPPSFADAKPLAGLPRLKSLRFRECVLEPLDAAVFRGWPQLTTLELGMSGAYIVSNKAELDGIQQLAGLRHISLGGRKIGKQHLALLRALPNLETLDVSTTTLGDAHIVDLAAFANLRKINIHRSQITPQGVAELQKKRPELIIVSQQVDRGLWN